MKSLKKQHQNPPESTANLKNMALDFINAGVGCNCLVALSAAGVLKKLIDNQILPEEELETFDNPMCIKSALVTLEKCRAIEKGSDSYKLTELGIALCEYIGLITIFFDGYGTLVANQASIVLNKSSGLEKLVKWPVVSESSIHISKTAVDPILIEEFTRLNLPGTICDLGCGHGVMLSKICKRTGNPGLGFESSGETVRQANQQLAHNITIEVADIQCLQGIWEDVIFLIQAFVFHDFAPEDKCINILNSYLESFPNLKYFFYIDIVTPCNSKNEIFPGFDYVHGLLGVPTRTYEETIRMFNFSNFTVMKEVCIPDLPNAFLWILSPKERNLR
jgi:hypothetical protein